MSWTPYVGDPNSATEEDATPVFVTNAADVQSWHRAPHTPIGRMDPGQRLQTALAGALGWSTFTPEQKWFRDRLGTGRWGGRMSTAPGESANRNLNMIRRHADGTCDLINLEMDGNFVLDLGGRGARDTRAGRC
jgi:hypothetical protein